MTENHNDTQPSWKNRRRFMLAVSVFFAGVAAYALGNDMTSKVAETAVTFALLGLAGIVGSYVFGAVWQDVSGVKGKR